MIAGRGSLNIPRHGEHLLSSARDVGAPGVDGVYGVGMLDAQAALSPLNWDNLDLEASH